MSTGRVWLGLRFGRRADIIGAGVGIGVGVVVGAKGKAWAPRVRRLMGL